jgi:hypothetical protein
MLGLIQDDRHKIAIGVQECRCLGPAPWCWNVGTKIYTQKWSIYVET